MMHRLERLYNLDFLRIVAMLMIVTLHFLGKGGVLGVAAMSSRYNLAWAIEEVCIVAVNCYVLISGYFLIKSRFRLSRLITLSFQVLFLFLS